MYLYLSVFDWIFIAGLSAAAVIFAIDNAMKLSKPLRTRFATLLNSRVWALAPLALVVLALVWSLLVISAGWVGIPGLRQMPYLMSLSVSSQGSSQTSASFWTANLSLIVISPT